MRACYKEILLLAFVFPLLAARFPGQARAASAAPALAHAGPPAAIAEKTPNPEPARGEDVTEMNEIFKKRHCVRSFQTKDVPREDLRAILQAANSAPSAGGLKAREIIVVTDAATRARLVRAALGQEFVGQAPVVLVFWAVPSRSAHKYGERGRTLYAVQDATIAASFAWLQAVALGLGGCWVGAFDENAVTEIFRSQIGKDWRPIALLPIGYSAE